MSSRYNIQFEPLGTATLLVNWPPKIDRNILFEIIALEDQLRKQMIEGISEINHAYHSIAISFDPEKISIHRLKDVITNLHKKKKDPPERKLWKIPVCYNEAYAPDLKSYCQAKEMNVDELVRLHTSGTYTVFFVGFLPGFLYLGGMDPQLRLPRKSSPERSVPNGSVAIGGEQTGIYPMASPGGWHVIGNSPLRFFNAAVDPPCFTKSGDELQFVPITPDDHKRISILVTTDMYQPQFEQING